MFNDKENLIRKYNECIICFESNSNRNIITLQDINYNKRTCMCIGYIHRICFYKWYNKNKTCPICTKDIIVKKKCCFF